MTSQPDKHLRRFACQDDRNLIVIAQPGDNLLGSRDGSIETRRADVGGLHTGRVIDDQHQVPSILGLPGKVRIGQGENQQSQQQKLRK